MDKKNYRLKLYHQVFALAPQVHPEAGPGQELLDAIRADIVLWRIGAKPSLSSLSIERLKELVAQYRRSLGQEAPPARDYERVGHRHQPDTLITEGQQRKIKVLFDILGYDAEGRRLICRRVNRRDWPQTRRDGNNLIACLQAMQARNYQPRLAAPGH